MSRNPNATGAPDADPAVVRFDDVSMRYGRAPETLKDLTFTLAPGSFHFVTGASGAGKTSLLKLLFLAAKPSKGLMHLFGQDVSTVAREDQPFLRRRIGVVYQEFKLLEHMSVFDNTALPLRIEGRKPDSYRNDVGELLAWVQEVETRRRGEMVLIVEGHKLDTEALPAEALRTLALLQKELPLKKAAALAAEIHGVKKNALYKYALDEQEGDK